MTYMRKAIWLLAAINLVWIPHTAAWGQSDDASENGWVRHAGTHQDRQLAELFDRVRQFEFDQKYSQAAESWSTVVDYLAEKHGPSSWQVTSAKTARDTAVQMAQFSSAQLEAAAEIFRLQTEANRAARQNDAPQTIEKLQQALRQASEIFGEKTYLVAKIQLQLGQLHQRNGDTQRAYQHFRDVHMTLRQVLGRIHPEVESIQYEIAKLLRHMNRVPQSLAYFEECENIAKQVYGPRHATYALRLNDLGTAHHALGDHQTAIEFLTRALDICRQGAGRDTEQMATCLLNLGIVRLEQKEYSQASTDLELASGIFQSKLGHRHPHTLDAKTRLATSLLLGGQLQRAEDVLAEVYRDKLARLGPRHLATCQTAYQLAVVQARRGAYDEAIPLIAQALAVQETKLGLDHGQTQKTVGAYVRMLERSGRVAEMEDLKRTKSIR